MHAECTHETVATDARIAQVAHGVVYHGLDVSLTNPRRLLARSGLRDSVARVVAREHGVHDDLAGLLDAEELVGRVVLSAQGGRRQASLAQVIVGAVETLVADTDDLVVANIADYVLVNRRRCSVSRTVTLGLHRGWRTASSIERASVASRSHRVVEELSGSGDGEERVRRVMLLTTIRVRDARRAQVVIYAIVNEKKNETF